MYSLLWKSIFVIWSVIWVWFIYSDITAHEFNENRAVGIGVALFGLYGLAFKKKIWKQVFWKIYFWVLTMPGLVTGGIVIYSVFIGSDYLSSEWEKGNIPISHLIEVSREVIFYLALIFAIYSYGYKSNNIWNKAPNHAN